MNSLWNNIVHCKEKLRRLVHVITFVTFLILSTMSMLIFKVQLHSKIFINCIILYVVMKNKIYAWYKIYVFFIVFKLKRFNKHVYVC